jgi:hypothetical protein
MARRIVDVAVIIPDASPVLTLARIGRIDLLGSFTVPIKIVDQAYFEITKPENDPAGEVAAALNRLHNHIEIIETNVGVGFQTRRARNPREPSGNLGEIAVDEYATMLAHTTGPGFVPLVLFEDPDVMELRIARLKDVHLLNTTGWLLQDPHGSVREDRVDEEGAAELVAKGISKMNEDLKGYSLADVLEKLEKGKMGHRAAMEWLNVSSYDALVEIMHVNGRLMPGHQPMRVSPRTRELVRSISRAPGLVRPG